LTTPPTFTERAASLEKTLATKPLIRAVNFHNASRAESATYERQLARYSHSFSSVNEAELDHYLKTGQWHKSKPGLIVSVFEGYRNGFDVLAPVIEKYGFVGWFFIITGFLNSPIKDQLTFAGAHRIHMQTREYPDGRYAMTWDEVRQLSAKHVIASHARSHTQLSTLDPATAEREVVGSQEDFQKELGHKVRAFVSLTGPAYGENPASDRLVETAGYDLIFSNFSIQRLNPLTQSPAKDKHNLSR
jgi:peptidoglycan/xylan/chitin deacetylase (PgdA/CDA1 family)